ncbi:hypothetical protein AAG906_021885 [Vitis piasezkii]
MTCAGEKEIFKQALLKPGPLESFALQIVQEAIKPQKQTKLAQDENQLLENILRKLLQELVSCAVQSGEKIMQYGQSIDDEEAIQSQIPRLLDIVLYLCEKEHVEGGMIFQLLEDLTEMSTMRNCKDIFAYIESKQDILGKQELFARGKLVMLRTCNQLLRANDVVFCGRILMFLAHFFPLSERSAVNIKGVFNTSNETKYEKDAPEGISIDFNFYKTFWSLQEHFCNPASISLAPTKWQKFTSNLMVVLNTFEAQPLSDEEGNANNLEEEAATFSIKYLTSSKLMGLELKDPSFRRHILVQCLILFDYLKAPGKNDKDLPSDSMKEEIKSCEERVKKLLEMTPPKGKEFLHNIEHILEREKNWVWWKRDGCPPFERQPIEKKAVQDGAKNGRHRPRWRMGNKELSKLWKWADQNPRVRTPAVYCWKGLRFAARQDLDGFSRFTEYGIEGVVPMELLPSDVRSKYQAKPSDRSKRAKKEETKGAAQQAEENQVFLAVLSFPIVDLEASAAPMDTDVTATTPTADENQKQSSDTDAGQEAGQSEADAEAEAGMIDGETDAEVDLDAVG